MLRDWLQNRRQITGILTPDIDGKRKLWDIRSGVYYELEIAPEHASTDSIHIGRFYFDAGVFKQAQEILLQSIALSPEWILVDEIGKLELQYQSGLEPAVSTLIHHFRRDAGHSKLLLVVRDYLLQEVIHHYELQEATVIKDFAHGM